MVSGFSSAHNRRSPRSRYAMSNDGFFDAHSKQHVHRLLVVDNIDIQYILNLFKQQLVNTKGETLKSQSKIIK